LKNLDLIYFAARELSPGDRPAYLARVCGGDQTLRARVEQMLAVSDEAEAFITDFPDNQPEARKFAREPGETVKVNLNDLPDETVGQKIGRYKILEKVGEGGCGVVYVAEQTEPVRRRVALKVIKLGMDTRQVVARFEAERQALAMMDHPNIAKVLDGGATDNGRPYFVMELVRGIKITDYCDQASLPTRERLELFIKVCQAIQHAHQKGIIHRDIKPSNILVTLNDGIPVPKVIDFGIAKATEGRLTEATVYTQLHQFIGTPAYMSPEQAQMSSLDIDTRSDIYSLGVLLYELLAGSTPFDPKELLAAGLDAMRRTIREEEPVRPSTRLAMLTAEQQTTTANRRACQLPRLIHTLKGDLDWVALKCLEKDRLRRYDTANGLALDIQRYLSGETVTAVPPSASYRLRKFVRRNRGLVVAAVLILTSLLLGLAGATIGLVQAKRQSRRAIAARHDESVQRAVAETARNTAQLQARIAEENAALASQQAMALLTGIQGMITQAQASAPPLPPKVMESILDVALKSADKVADNYDKSKTSKEATTAAILSMLGDLYMQMGRPADARKRYLTMHEILKERVRIKQGSDPSRSNLAASYRRLGTIALSIDRDPAKSLAAYREALALRQDIYEHPKHDGSETAPWLNALELAVAEQDLAVAEMRVGNLAEARKHFERGLVNSREAATLNPAKTEESQQLTFSLIGVGEIRRRFGQLEEARSLFDEALSLQDGVDARHPDSLDAKMALRSVLIQIAIAWRDDPGRCNKFFERAEKLAREILNAQPDRADSLSALASLLLERGLTLWLANPTAATAKFAECATIRRRLAALAGPADTQSAVRLAVALGANGEVEEARARALGLHDIVKSDPEALVELATCLAFGAVHASGGQQEELCVQSESLLREAVALHFIDPFLLRFRLGNTPLLTRPAVKSMLASMDDQTANQRSQ
jgi:serine/threonine protein kinase